MTSENRDYSHPPLCPLCDSSSLLDYHRDARRPYNQCRACQLVFVAVPFHLSAAEEKAQYDLHQNNPHDAGYRRFLNRLAEPVLAMLKPHSQGLDFGCGPGPCLSLMLAERGHSVALYDLYYANHPQLLEQQYDFITATEVVEHLANPGAELQRLWQCLKPGGLLGLMTKLVANPERFANWHYKTDPTHISFFSRATFEHLGKGWGSAPQFVGTDAIIFRKPLLAL